MKTFLILSVTHGSVKEFENGFQNKKAGKEFAALQASVTYAKFASK